MTKQERVKRLLLLLVDTPSCDAFLVNEMEALGRKPTYQSRDDTRAEIAEILADLITSFRTADFY